MAEKHQGVPRTIDETLLSCEIVLPLEQHKICLRLYGYFAVYFIPYIPLKLLVFGKWFGHENESHCLGSQRFRLGHRGGGYS